MIQKNNYISSDNLHSAAAVATHDKQRDSMADEHKSLNRTMKVSNLQQQLHGGHETQPSQLESARSAGDHSKTKQLIKVNKTKQKLDSTRRMRVNLVKEFSDSSAERQQSHQEQHHHQPHVVLGESKSLKHAGESAPQLDKVAQANCCGMEDLPQSSARSLGVRQ